MKTDFSNINSEGDLDKATQDITERIAYNRQQIKNESRELPGSVARATLQKTVPWLVGAATGLAAIYLIKKMAGSSKKHTPIARVVKSTLTESPVKSKVASAVALQILPIAGLIVKNWIARRRANRSIEYQP